MAYAAVRTDNMSGTVNGSDLVSVKFYNGTTETAIENGNVVLVGDFMDGEREVRKATAPAADSPLSKVALIASEEVVKTKTYNTIADFRNEAGDICRGYRLVQGNIFSVTKEAFSNDAGLDVGSIVELVAGTKLSAVATATSGSTTVGKIVLIEGEWYVIEVA